MIHNVLCGLAHYRPTSSDCNWDTIQTEGERDQRQVEDHRYRRRTRSAHRSDLVLRRARASVQLGYLLVHGLQARLALARAFDRLLVLDVRGAGAPVGGAAAASASEAALWTAAFGHDHRLLGGDGAGAGG